MKDIGYYLSSLKEQKQELSETLEKKGIPSSSNESLISLVDKVESLEINFHPLDFVSSKQNIVLSLSGEGEIKIYGNEELLATIPLGKELVKVNLSNPLNAEECRYYFNTVNGISEIDIHGNEITELAINEANTINKLVVYDNNISLLDCSSCDDLQFLHIHNNPMCDSEIAITRTIESLTDRTNKATGSIIFYPWFGLETLIEFNEGKHYKYPYLPNNTGNYSNANSMHYSWNYDNEGNYKFEDGRLYGIVTVGSNGARDVISERRVYSGSRLLTAEETDGLEEYKNINEYHRLRINVLEKISLKKNWIFGSAIMYNESEWEKCPWDFRKNHIADMWETSEKGFGYTVGIFDNITLLFPGAQDLNIVSYQNNLVGDNRTAENSKYSTESPNYLSKTYTNAYYFDNGKIDHGDYILGIICGNGATERMGGRNNPLEESRRYGNVPLAKIVAIDKYKPSGKSAPDSNAINYINATDKNSEEYKKLYAIWKASDPNCVKYLSTLQTNGIFDCDTLTFSMGSPSRTATEASVFEEFGKWRKYFNQYASQNIFTAPAGNSGDGIETTSEEDTWYDAFYGHNNEAYKFEGDLPCQVIYTHALDHNDEPGSFSRSSPYSERSKLSAIDFYSSYGANTLSEANTFVQEGEAYIKKGYSSGTSFSTPNLCSNLLLLRIIYSKLPEATLSSFGKFSPYMDYVRDHWCDIVEKETDLSIGYGKPDILAKPGIRKFIAKNTNNGDKDGLELIADIGEYVQDLNGTVYKLRSGEDKVRPRLASKNNIQIGTVNNDFSRVDYSQYLTFNLSEYKDCTNDELISGYDGAQLSSATLMSINQPCTISFLIDFVPGSFQGVTGSPIPVFKLNGENYSYIFECRNYTVENGKWTGIERVMFTITQQNGEGVSRGALVGLPFFHKFIENYSKVVFTITIDENKMSLYLNGERFIHFDTNLYYEAAEKFSLPNLQNSINVYKWNRILSQEEIIRNSAALLKK